MTTKEYARDVGARLARNTIKQYISEWAKNRVPPPKGESRHLFNVTEVRFSRGKEDEKLINGHQVGEFWKHVPEADARMILADKKYLTKGKCSWEELWEAYTNI